MFLKRQSNGRSLLGLMAVATMTLLLSSLVWAQSTTTGAVSGRVTDPSGAVIPGAKVTLTDNATGATRTTVSDSSGIYDFAYVKPGSYTVKARAKGFQLASLATAVSVGAVGTVNFALQLAAETERLSVTAEAPVVQTGNANVSQTVTPLQVTEVPNPGNDLTALVQAEPGTVMNTQAGYGNFSMYGLPATSNLFTVDGMNDNDPFLNLNNSGATNLMLGANDISEATVVTNGYGGEYGGLAGAYVNYVSKSGTNQWHGDAMWQWNGRAMNANSFFNNATATPRAFDNVNSWATALGGPIKKNKIFFFVDFEGTHILLPTSAKTLVPTAAFESATLTNLANAGLTNSIPYYKNMFSLYNSAPGSGAAKNTEPNGGCDNITTGELTAVGMPAGAPCVDSFRSTATNLTKEWQLTERVDFNISDSDRLFVRELNDRGFQATYTDPISPIFNGGSNQPETQAQLGETHLMGSNKVNSFRASLNWYSAIFTAPNLAKALATFPTTMIVNDGSLAYMGGIDLDWPEGRKVTQYQFVDDFSWTKGNHTLRFGGDFIHYNTSDFDYGIYTSGLELPFTLDDFFWGGVGQGPNGAGDLFEQSFPSSLVEPIANYGLGFYGEDDWQVRPGLKLTFSLRGDKASNPECIHNCFARLVSPFPSLNHSASIPYNQSILTNQRQALTGLTNIGWEPRFGFAWQPFGTSHNTVLRGGFGIFYDAFPAFAAESISENPPLDNTFLAFFDNLSPAESSNLFLDTSTANSTFLSQYASGGTLASIEAADPLFAPPTFFGTEQKTHAPRYQKWNLEIEQGIGKRTRFSLDYVGDHGVHEALINNGINAYAPGFVGLPSAPPDSRFGTVSYAQSNGDSSYNGLTVSLQSQFSQGYFQVAYTWSHALDDVSNGGFLPFSFDTNTSALNPQDPYNIRGNWGPADYDARHYFTTSYVWQVPFKRALFGHGPDALVNGWQLSGTLFTRSGLPYTPYDSNATSALSSTNYGAQIRATFLGGAVTSCSSPVTPCLTTSQFAPSTSSPTGFGITQRNFFRGPNYFDTDMQVTKYTTIPHWETARLGLGLQFFNLFNHPNFDQPVADIANPQFGTIINTLSPPTSVMAAFLGGDASPRMIQLKVNLTF